MLADADLPEADDEFSYREDPRQSLVDMAYPPARILALAQERYRHPLSYVAGTGMDERLHPLIPCPLSSEHVSGPLEAYAIAHPYVFGDGEGDRHHDPLTPLPETDWTSADARWRAACGIGPLPRREAVESKDNDPAPTPLTRCPVCRAFGVLSAVLDKMPGRKS